MKTYQTYKGYTIHKRIRKVDGVKQPPLFCPALAVCGWNLKDIKARIDLTINLNELTEKLIADYRVNPKSGVTKETL